MAATAKVTPIKPAPDTFDATWHKVAAALGWYAAETGTGFQRRAGRQTAPTAKRACQIDGIATLASARLAARGIEPFRGYAA